MHNSHEDYLLEWPLIRRQKIISILTHALITPFMTVTILLPNLSVAGTMTCDSTFARGWVSMAREVQSEKQI